MHRPRDLPPRGEPAAGQRTEVVARSDTVTRKAICLQALDMFQRTSEARLLSAIHFAENAADRGIAEQELFDELAGIEAARLWLFGCQEPVAST